MNSTLEQWLPVVGYEGFYEISDQGRVKSLSRWRALGAGGFVQEERIMKLCLGGPKRCYWYVGLRRLGVKRRRVRVHRLVLEAFVGLCPKGTEACHNDGDPTNNRLENLRWDSRAANAKDRETHGTAAKGERIGNAKLSDTQAAEIRLRYRRTAYHDSNAVSLAIEYGVSKYTILGIAKGETYAHV